METPTVPIIGSVRYVPRQRRDAYGRMVWVIVREELIWREVGRGDGPFLDREEAQAFADAYMEDEQRD